MGWWIRRETERSVCTAKKRGERNERRELVGASSGVLEEEDQVKEKEGRRGRRWKEEKRRSRREEKRREEKRREEKRREEKRQSRSLETPAEPSLGVFVAALELATALISREKGGKESEILFTSLLGEGDVLLHTLKVCLCGSQNLGFGVWFESLLEGGAERHRICGHLMQLFDRSDQSVSQHKSSDR